MAPVPVAMIMTAVLQRGIAIPQQAALVAVEHTPSSVQLCPPPTHYACSSRRWATEQVDVATHFFETGVVPPVRKRLASELVRPAV